MPEFKDHFSQQSAIYGRYRPLYPDSLYEHLASLCQRHELAWDCGCGNGQAAHGLARHFAAVAATDASAAQIDKAVPGEGIRYRVATAEQSGLDSGSVDLLLVAQALHWFDFPKFFAEAKRVLHPGGVFAAVTYGLLRIDPEIDGLIDHLYVQELGEYWPVERKHVDNAYASIPFPFEPLAHPEFTMQAEWDMEHLLGYLETWSAVQQARKRAGHCPVAAIVDKIRQAWEDGQHGRTVTWPVTLKAGTVW